MEQSAWNQKSIKMTAHHKNKIATGKVTLKKNGDLWEVTLNAFWTRPTQAQMFIVGNTARKILDIDASEGAFYASRKISAINWDDFIYRAKMVVVISDGIPLLRANIPAKSDVDVHTAMTIIRCDDKSEISHQDKKDTIKKEVEQLALRDQIEISTKQQEVKNLLTLNPKLRTKTANHLRASSYKRSTHIEHTPMEWGMLQIEDAIEDTPIPSPFIGNFDGAQFARVAVADAYGFSHMIACKIAVNNMYIYMLCIPGNAYQPPHGMPDYSRWIPAIEGNGYWVKYILSK